MAQHAGRKPGPAERGRSEVRRWHVFGLEQVQHRQVSQEWAPHWHAEWSIGAVVRGECRCSAAGWALRPRAGDLIAIAPNVVHAGALLAAGEPGPVLVTMFYVPPAWFEGSGLPPPAGTGLLSGAPSLARDAESLRTREEVQQWLEAAVGLLSELEPIGETGYGPSPAARRLLAEVHLALLDGQFTVGRLARRCGVSRERLYRVVRRWTGMSPAEYCRGVRVNRARAMLLGGDSPSDAALACGFSDQAHFTRWFRRAFGYTPGDLQSASWRS